MRGVTILCIIGLLLTAGCVGHNQVESTVKIFHGKDLESVEKSQFNLTGMDGKNWSTDEALGKVVILSFGFINCRTTCHMVWSNIYAVLQELTPEEREQVEVVTVTVDPWRDTPEALANFTSERGYDWIHLSGNDTAVLDVLVSHYIFISPTSEDDYDIMHQQPTYLLDRELDRRVLWNDGNWMLELFLEDLRVLLAE